MGRNPEILNPELPRVSRNQPNPNQLLAVFPDASLQRLAVAGLCPQWFVFLHNEN